MPANDPLLAQQDPPVRAPLTFEKIVAAAAMAALCLITLGNVVARYLTNYSFAFTEEYSIALMVVVTMLGAAIATAADRQIRITWFADLLPSGPRRAAEIAATVAVIGMFVLMVILGGRLDRKSTRLNSSHANISYAVFRLKKKNPITLV